MIGRSLSFSNAMWLAFLALVVMHASAQYVTVNTKFGPVMGNVRETVDEWLGVPYAAPPVGDLRFKLPQDPTPWSSPYNATVPHEECPQMHVVKKLYEGSEDCLYLDVYRPTGTSAGDNVPVMAFIHGGAFIAGNALGSNGSAREVYNGTNLASKHGVIVVSMQYRLGVFGFLALTELASETPEKTTGNYAMQDQRLALQWIQNNIAAFGGDPSKVLLFGESAGGGSVCYHYTSPASAGLFSSIIAESPVCSDPEFFISYDVATGFGAAFAKHVGCGAGGLLTLDCLRTKPTYDILESLIQWDWEFPPGTPLPLLTPLMPWGPAVDGSRVGVVDRPLNMINNNNFNKVPAIIGSNENEGTIFAEMAYLLIPDMSFPITNDDVTRLVEHFIDNSTVVQEILTVYYPESSFMDQYSRIAILLRDFIFRCNIRNVVTGPSGPPTWIYRFNKTRDSPLNELMGDFHGSELPLVFDHPWADWKAQDYALSEQMGCYWSSMAKYGNPNQSGCPGVINWPENMGPGQDWNIVLDWTLRAEQNLSQIECDYWDSIAELVWN